MPFARTSAMRSAFRAARSTRAALSKPQPWQRAGHRSYATSGHKNVKSSSELPWLIGSVTFSVAGSAYLLSGRKSKSGHGDHGEKHEEHEEAEDAPEDASKDDAASEKSDEGSEDESKQDSTVEPKDNAKEEQKSDESDSDDEEAKEAETPATSDDGIEYEENDKNRILLYQDPKGGIKKRFDSKASIKQGKEEDTADPDHKDKAAASKEPAGGSSTSSKQEHISNTDTKHSTDIMASPISKKGEGIPETAKAKGTINPTRPQV